MAFHCPYTQNKLPACNLVSPSSNRPEFPSGDHNQYEQRRASLCNSHRIRQNNQSSWGADQGCPNARLNDTRIQSNSKILTCSDKCGREQKQIISSQSRRDSIKSTTSPGCDVPPLLKSCTSSDKRMEPLLSKSKAGKQHPCHSSSFNRCNNSKSNQIDIPITERVLIKKGTPAMIENRSQKMSVLTQNKSRESLKCRICHNRSDTDYCAPSEPCNQNNECNLILNAGDGLSNDKPCENMQRNCSRNFNCELQKDSNTGLIKSNRNHFNKKPINYESNREKSVNVCKNLNNQDLKQTGHQQNASRLTCKIIQNDQIEANYNKESCETSKCNKEPHLKQTSQPSCSGSLQSANHQISKEHSQNTTAEKKPQTFEVSNTDTIVILPGKTTLIEVHPNKNQNQSQNESISEFQPEVCLKTSFFCQCDNNPKETTESAEPNNLQLQKPSYKMPCSSGDIGSVFQQDSQDSTNKSQEKECPKDTCSNINSKFDGRHVDMSYQPSFTNQMPLRGFLPPDSPVIKPPVQHFQPFIQQYPGQRYQPPPYYQLQYQNPQQHYQPQPPSSCRPGAPMYQNEQPYQQFPIHQSQLSPINYNQPNSCPGQTNQQSFDHYNTLCKECNVNNSPVGNLMDANPDYIGRHDYYNQITY